MRCAGPELCGSAGCERCHPDFDAPMTRLDWHAVEVSIGECWKALVPAGALLLICRGDEEDDEPWTVVFVPEDENAAYKIISDKRLTMQECMEEAEDYAAYFL